MILRLFPLNVILLGLTFFLPNTLLAQETPPTILEGAKARLVGQGVGNQGGFIRHWKGLESGAEWQIDVPANGKYHLYFNAACPGDQGGLARLFVDGIKAFDWEVPHTKNFDDFQMVRAGELTLTRGRHTLRILSQKLNATFLMDIKNGFLSTSDQPDTAKKWEEEQKKRLQAALNEAKTFPQAVLATQKLLAASPSDADRKIILDRFDSGFAPQKVWLEQDTGEKAGTFLQTPATTESIQNLVNIVLKTVKNKEALLKEQKTLLDTPGTSTGSWLALYEKAAWARRQERLDRVRAHASEFIFAKHHIFGSVNGIYLMTETEGSSQPSALCTINLNEEKKGGFAQPRVLVDPGEGAVRDPELSFDGKKLLFAMKPSRQHFNSTCTYEKYAIYCPAPNKATYLNDAYGRPESNYQIYERDMETGTIRALTTTETYGSSFEPCYLPNGDIMFSSSRIVQHITCGWGDLSNLFIMNKDGKYARRVGFDQTNTAFPALLNDGRVVFTRRDYNDRGQTSAHALFQMNPDGSNQTEYYGNQTGLPNSFQHARAIPGSDKLIVILGGYHNTQGGKLALMDIKQGRQKDQGIVEVPGYKKPVAGDGYSDAYGKSGVQYSNPYALTEKDYIVSIAPRNRAPYGLYYLNDMGERELLAGDPATSCLQAIPNKTRPVPPHRPTFLDYTKDDGTFYVQNVYYGEGAKGIKPGSIKKIRIIEILYKNVTTGTGMGKGPGGNWDTVTPSGHGLATFDSKSIIGDATVYEDGSAMFTAPARKPLYFQLLDEDNHVVQTMRSWTTLMPNEKFSCVGCHEDKNTTPLAANQKTIAFTRGAEKLKNFYGSPRAFSFPFEVQPIFDKHCISCHKADGEARELVLTAEPYVDDPRTMRRYYRSYFNLTKARPLNAHQPEEFGFFPDDKVWGPRIVGQRQPDEPNKYVSWYTRFELMRPYPPYRADSIRSGLVRTLEKGHKNVKLSGEELDKIRAWIDLNIPFAGEYDESNLWSDAEKSFYRRRVEERRRNEELEKYNILEYIRDGQP